MGFGNKDKWAVLRMGIKPIRPMWTCALIVGTWSPSARCKRASKKQQFTWRQKRKLVFMGVGLRERRGWGTQQVITQRRSALSGSKIVKRCEITDPVKYLGELIPTLK